MPQLENGYFKIANELFDALIRYRIPGTERQCFDFIIRKTYGFNKKEDVISNSQFVKATGLKKQNVLKALNSLILKEIVIKRDYQGRVSYRINKYFSTWKMSSKRITKRSNQKGLPAVIKSDDGENVIKKDDQTILNQRFSEDFPGPEPYKEQTIGNNDLSSKVMNTKDSNNVTKDRGNPERVKKKISQKTLLLKMRILSSIISGNQDHGVVGNYGQVGESFPEMQVRAKRELDQLKRDIKK